MLRSKRVTCIEFHVCIVFNLVRRRNTLTDKVMDGWMSRHLRRMVVEVVMGMPYLPHKQINRYTNKYKKCINISVPRIRKIRKKMKANFLITFKYTLLLFKKNIRKYDIGTVKNRVYRVNPLPIIKLSFFTKEEGYPPYDNIKNHKNGCTLCRLP